MDWKQLLVYISGSVEEELVLRIAYLVAENRILRDQITGRVQLSDTERRTLAAIGTKLSTQALEEVASIVKPDTILAWHRTLVAPVRFLHRVQARSKRSIVPCQRLRANPAAWQDTWNRPWDGRSA